MAGNMVGYNPDLVYRSLMVLQNYAKDIIELYGTGLQRRVIDPLSQAWFAPESKTVVSPLVESIKTTLNDFMRTVDGAANDINEAAQKWASSVGDTWGRHSINYPGIALDATVMKDDNSGFRGVNSELLPDIYAELDKIPSDTAQCSGKFKQEFVCVEAFLGGEQMTNLINRLTSLAGVLESSSSAAVGSIEKAVKDTEERYHSTAQTNASTFASSN